MTDSSRVRVYIACSFDGYIAGPDDDISWLYEAAGDAGTAAPSDPMAVTFEGFMAEVGAMLMGRRTHDVVAGLGEEWPYGDTPVLVATHRALEPTVPTVQAVTGDIGELIAQAKAVAAVRARDQSTGPDVYLDGGNLIQQALNARLVDELIITFVPVILGGGIKLFDGPVTRQSVEFVGHYHYAPNMVQVVARRI